MYIMFTLNLIVDMVYLLVLKKYKSINLFIINFIFLFLLKKL
jgi:hypothetical protein